MVPHITAICASYNRPKLLGQAVAMFLAQDHPNRDLIILEDSGIFGEQTLSGFGWQMRSTKKRFSCVASKRNWIAKTAPGEYLAVWDDDDWYFPWHLSAAAAALEYAPWVQPRAALEWERDNTLSAYYVFGEPMRERCPTGPTSARDACDCCYGAQWSYRRAQFLKTGGYPEGYGNGEDGRWSGEMYSRFGPSADPLAHGFPPSYVYSRARSGSWHGSEMGPGMAYQFKIGRMPKANSKDFVIRLPDGYERWTKANVPTNPKPRKW